MLQLQRCYLRHQAWQSREQILCSQPAVISNSLFVVRLLILLLEDDDEHDRYVDAVLPYCSQELSRQYPPVMD